MTFFTDPYLLLLTGGLFALAASQKDIPVLKRKSFWFGFIEAVVITALAAWFYVMKPDWMWMYSVRSNETPVWLGPSLFFLYPAPYVAAYAIGLEMKKRSSRASISWFLLLGVVTVAMHGLIADRWTSWTTTAEYLQGVRTEFFATPVWIYLGISAILCVGTLVPLFLLARKKEERLLVSR